MAKKIKSRPTVEKNQQIFIFNAPAAQIVELVGDFTDWEEHPISMELNANGAWQAAVPLERGQYNYLFLVDGVWRDDPECSLQLPNPYGGRNSVRQVA